MIFVVNGCLSSMVTSVAILEVSSRSFNFCFDVSVSALNSRVSLVILSFWIFISLGHGSCCICLAIFLVSPGCCGFIIIVLFERGGNEAEVPGDAVAVAYVFGAWVAVSVMCFS